MKNYVGFVNDHSGSMSGLRAAAIKDYNANITATKNAASREELDTVVSVVGVGYPSSAQVTRQVVISNPHVLKPMTEWSTQGGTPLWDGIGNMIELLNDLPDSGDQNVSYLVITTTDGQEENSTKYSHHSLRDLIIRQQATGRWTFVFRVPRGQKHRVSHLGVPLDNIQEWDTTDVGMAVSTVQTVSAMDQFYTARSSGAKSSTSFYTNTAKVNTSALVDISNKVSLYVVDGVNVPEGMLIRDFVLTKRSQYLKGAAFYQLTKTEPKVQEGKLVCVRDRDTGKIYGGQQAREMVGLPKFGNARLHPGDHSKYDIFIQSESVNRRLVKGTGLLYWEEKGVPFTQEELERFLSPSLPPKPAVVQLPAVPVSNKPTKSPITPVKVVLRPVFNGKQIITFANRREARAYAKEHGKSVVDLIGATVHGFPGIRWAVYA